MLASDLTDAVTPAMREHDGNQSEDRIQHLSQQNGGASQERRTRE